MAESAGTPPLEEFLTEQTLDEMRRALQKSQVLYLDLFTNQVEHAAHSANQPAELVDVLQGLDTLAGKLWSVIETAPLASETIFVVISDPAPIRRCLFRAASR